jgi:hypothetical protein
LPGRHTETLAIDMEESVVEISLSKPVFNKNVLKDSLSYWTFKKERERNRNIYVKRGRIGDPMQIL